MIRFRPQDLVWQQPTKEGKRIWLSVLSDDDEGIEEEKNERGKKCVVLCVNMDGTTTGGRTEGDRVWKWRRRGWSTRRDRDVFLSPSRFSREQSTHQQRRIPFPWEKESQAKPFFRCRENFWRFFLWLIRLFLPWEKRPLSSFLLLLLALSLVVAGSPASFRSFYSRLALIEWKKEKNKRLFPFFFFLWLCCFFLLARGHFSYSTLRGKRRRK